MRVSAVGLRGRRRSGLWLIAFGALIALAAWGGDQARAAFPGVNGKIAYTAEQGDDSSIWAINPDGTGAGAVTTAASDYSPTYSADGKRIAFLRGNDLYVMNADGGDQTLLRTGSYSWSEDTEVIEDYEDPETEEEYPFVRVGTYEEQWDSFSSPSFSPDGSTLAVAHGRGDYSSTWVCAIETADSEECIEEGEPGFFEDYESECVGCAENVVSVSSTSGATLGDLAPEGSWNPAYAADGKLAYLRSDGEFDPVHVVVVPTPGAPPVVVHDGWTGDVDFSPDSTQLVLTREDELTIVGAGGGTVGSIAIPMPPGAEWQWLSGAVFSPDGSKLAFAREADGEGPLEQGIFTIGTDGSGLSEVVTSAYRPSWQPLPASPPSPGPARVLAPVPVKPIGLIKPPAKKGKVKLDKKGQTVIGTIVCGSTTCKVKLLSAKLKVAKKTYDVDVPLPKSLAPNKKKKVKVKVKGKGLAALKQAGVGKLTVKVSVTDAAGKKTLTLKSTLAPPAQPKGKKGKVKKG